MSSQPGIERVVTVGTTVMYVCAIATLILTCLKAAPYGRYAKSGMCVPARVAWFLFESPNVIIPIYVTTVLPTAPVPHVNRALLGIFLVHYIHRSLVYPLRMPRAATPMPVPVLLAAGLFSTCNACLQSLGLLHEYPRSWARDVRFVVGVVVAFIGMGVNIAADSTLLRLRESGRYQIPRGVLFRFVSCPNFLGEILEWSGWALACWSHTAASFAFYTFCNTAPRACSHHRFYKRTFSDYPKDRLAVIPFVL